MYQTRGIGANVNYKLFARIKPIDVQNKMIEMGPENTLIIKDNSSANKDKTTFQFNGAFDAIANQETVWANACEPCILKAIEGHNSCILTYGQTNSGKSYTLFGEDEKYYINPTSIFTGVKKDRRGMIPRTIEYLFRKGSELDDVREFVITCTLVEVYLDQVRDLGKAIIYKQQGVDKTKIQQQYLSQNLNVYENTNGQIVVKDVTYVQISKMSDLYEMLQAAFELRDKVDTKTTCLWQRSHTIFTINIVQKDKENDNIPFMSSTMQFVDLSGNERITKSLTEGYKFQEAILINQQLTALGKCLQQIAKSNKTIPYRESRLTRLLQNTLGIACHVILITTLNPQEQYYEDCLFSLQYCERTRVPQNKNQSVMIQNNFANNNVENQLEQEQINNGNDKMLKGLRDQIQELEAKIEYIQREHKQKMSEIQNLLGLDVDLDKLLSRSSQKDLQQFKMQREAVVKLEGVQKANIELENKIEKLKKCLEEIRQEDYRKQERQSCQIIEFQELIRKIKDQQSTSKMQTLETIRRNIQEREKEIELMNEKSKILTEEKLNMIKNLPEYIKKYQQPKTVIDNKKEIQTEVEEQSQTHIKKIQGQYQKILSVTKQQQEFILKSQNLEIEQLQEQVKLYSQQKKQYIIKLKSELVNLYDIVQKQNRILQKVEIGQYSGNKKPFRVPQNENPEMPNRQEYINLFKLLDQRHLKSLQDNGQNNFVNIEVNSASNINVTFGGGKANQDQNEQLQKSLLMSQVEQQDQRKSSVKINRLSIAQSMIQSKNMFLRNKQDTQQSQVQSQKAIKEKKIITDVNIDNHVNLSTVRGENDFSTLKQYANILKDSLEVAIVREKELREKVNEFEEINNEVDIKTIIKERDEYQKLYNQELRKSSMVSRGSSQLNDVSQRKFFITSLNQQQMTDKYNYSINFSRPQTNFQPQRSEKFMNTIKK